MSEGRTDKLLAVLERIAVANEALITLATEERAEREIEEQSMRETASVVPMCPHCDSINPEIRSEGAAGPMAELIVIAGCTSCGKMMIGVPASGMLYFKDKDDFDAYMERGADNGQDS